MEYCVQLDKISSLCIIYFRKMKEDDNFSIKALKQYSMDEVGKKSAFYQSTHKASSLFESLISTNYIEKNPFDFQPYRDAYIDYQADEVDLLKLEEMLPKINVGKKAEPSLATAKKNFIMKKQANFSIEQRSIEDESEYQAMNHRKKKKPNRSVQGSTNNMLINLKGMMQNYLNREKLNDYNEILPKGYLNMQLLKWLITSSALRPVLARMFQERYLQRAIVASSINLQHKMLYLKKLQKISRWSASVSDS